MSSSGMSSAGVPHEHFMWMLIVFFLAILLVAVFGCLVIAATRWVSGGD